MTHARGLLPYKEPLSGSSSPSLAPLKAFLELLHGASASQAGESSPLWEELFLETMKVILAKFGP